MTETKSVLIWLLVSVFVTSTVAKDWWETATFYQIYPRSFKDSNGDGVGDLTGITEKLPYLKELGVTAFWLSPIFKSPMKDFGYDISDFRDIQPEFGKMADFDNMLKEAKALGIKVILDFVPNHSSDQHEWFQKSERREVGFEDFYMWHPGKVNPVNASAPLPPNNWISVFRFSAWEWSPIRKEYYYHAFVKEQPDLNYRNPKVVEEMKAVLRFWLDKGVDGFRIDAVPNLFEVEKDGNGNYPDEPLSGNSVDPDDPAYLNHIHTTDQPDTIGMVYQWRAIMDEYNGKGDTRIIMTESYSPIDIVMQYYGNATQKGAHMPFNFQLLVNIKSHSNAGDFKHFADNWLTKMPLNGTANWVMGNHDQRRIASRFGLNKVDAINMILATLPGASVTYNGEEIGMTDVFITWEETLDPQGCNTNPLVYDKISRDPARTPFQWDDSTSAGFSSSNKTWLPVSPDYRERNVKQQEAASSSHLKIFKELHQLRQKVTLQEGDTTIATTANENVLVIMRNLTNSGTVITVANLGPNHEHVDLGAVLSSNVPASMNFAVVDSYGGLTKGATVESSHLHVDAYQSFVLSSAMGLRISAGILLANLVLALLFKELL